MSESRIASQANVQISEDFSLKPFNTFGLDTRAKWFAFVKSVDELQKLLRDEYSNERQKLILGGGSNILFTHDFHGLVIKNCIEGIDVLTDNDRFATVRVGAGMNWHAFVLYAISKGYPGIENLSLIPGCVGAAPIQNIGAYGVEIKSVFHELQALNIADGSMRIFTHEECRFGYRDSIFKREVKNKYAIVSVTFRFDKNARLNTSYGAIEEQLRIMGIAYPSIRDISNAVIEIRRSKLPDPAVIGNAGSFFKNPEVNAEQFAVLKEKFPDIVSHPSSNKKIKLAAGWLIEQCGWKGKQVGHVGMHAKQSLVLVNYGNATGSELIEHAKQVRRSVREKFGIEMEMEVNVI